MRKKNKTEQLFRYLNINIISNNPVCLNRSSVPVVCRKRRLNKDDSLGETVKTEAPCHSRCGTIKISNSHTTMFLYSQTYQLEYIFYMGICSFRNIITDLKVAANCLPLFFTVMHSLLELCCH